MTQIINMSSKGQIVVPKDLREELRLDTGSAFAVFGRDDTIILKKINIPKAKEMFEKVHKLGTELAKKKGWKEEELMGKLMKGRGIKSA